MSGLNGGWGCDEYAPNQATALLGSSHEPGARQFESGAGREALIPNGPWRNNLVRQQYSSFSDLFVSITGVCHSVVIPNFQKIL